jgi:hypothetical protein
MTIDLQSFLELATFQVSKLSPEQKREFRQAWLSQIDEREADRNFLRSCGVDTDGD